jgi:16S rRNA (guanine966-N2)-methyltransferase
MRNSVRITSGIYRGRSILTPGDGTHPMGERERLALFNKISEYLPGAKVLDAFAGSGALGIEAMSRGATSVTFVEKNPKAAKIIRENLKNLGINGDVVLGDANKYTSDEKFDVILIDPPYDDIMAFSNPFFQLAKEGILVLSHPGDAPQLPGLSLVDSRKYAGATLSYYANAK